MLKQIEGLIYEYHWRKKEMDRIENMLFGHRIPISKSVGVAQYGIEATLPHGSKLKSYAEMEAMDRREERQYKRWESYRTTVCAIEVMADSLEDEQELIIIDCMMEGMSYRSIADHLGISRNKLGQIKNEMLNHLSQKCHFVLSLLEEKSA